MAEKRRTGRIKGEGQEGEKGRTRRVRRKVLEDRDGTAERVRMEGQEGGPGRGGGVEESGSTIQVRSRICKRLWSPGIDSEESIPRNRFRQPM
jgi:hypothetical protein